MSNDVQLRPAHPADAAEVAELFLATRQHSMHYLPRLHSDAETHPRMAAIVLRQCAATIAVCDGRIVGFTPVHGDMLEHLYVLPAHHGRGIGDALRHTAKAASSAGVQLHVVQQSHQARRFYEQRGFALVALGDGSGNEKATPDAQYAWPGSHAA